MNPGFVAGRDISRDFAAVVEPRLRGIIPQTSFALAFIGPGSDVLGYDTERSVDHDWGPRLTIVVPHDEVSGVARAVVAAIDTLLPASVSGFPTRFSAHLDGSVYPDSTGAVHRLQVTSVQQFLQSNLDIESLGELSENVWLSTPMQSLLELTSGLVLVDDTGELTRVRRNLHFYPDSIWMYQLAALWMRVNQMQPLVGRTGEVGDDTGSAMTAMGVARDFMRIGLLQSRRYAPYAKWLGSVSGRISIGTSISPFLHQVAHADTWIDREAGLNAAGSLLIEHLNGLGIIDHIVPAASPFFTRPYSVLPAEQIAIALQATLRDSENERLPPFLGGIDMVTDSTDAIKSCPFRLAFRTMLEQAAQDT